MLQGAFAKHRVLGSLGGLAGAGGQQNFLDHVARIRRMLLQELLQCFVHHGLHRSPGLGRTQAGLGLAFELRLRQLHRDDHHQALARVLARQVLVLLFQKILATGVGVERAGQRRTETGQVHAAVGRIDVIGKAELLGL